MTWDVAWGGVGLGCIFLGCLVCGFIFWCCCRVSGRCPDTLFEVPGRDDDGPPVWFVYPAADDPAEAFRDEARLN